MFFFIFLDPPFSLSLVCLKIPLQSMLTVQVLEDKTESQKNEWDLVIICRFESLLFALIGAWWNACVWDEATGRSGDTSDGCRRGGRLSPSLCADHCTPWDARLHCAQCSSTLSVHINQRDGEYYRHTHLTLCKILPMAHIACSTYCSTYCL